MSVTFLALSLCKININHTKGEDSKQYGGLVNLKICGSFGMCMLIKVA